MIDEEPLLGEIHEGEYTLRVYDDGTILLSDPRGAVGYGTLKKGLDHQPKFKRAQRALQSLLEEARETYSELLEEHK